MLQEKNHAKRGYKKSLKIKQNLEKQRKERKTKENPEEKGKPGKKQKETRKNPAYGRHQLSRPMRIV